MSSTVITTDQEKFEMYDLLSKEQLIKMLIEANKHLYRLTPKIIMTAIKNGNTEDVILG